MDLGEVVREVAPGRDGFRSVEDRERLVEAADHALAGGDTDPRPATLPVVVGHTQGSTEGLDGLLDAAKVAQQLALQ
jgi:hypothetical protein